MDYKHLSPDDTDLDGQRAKERKHQARQRAAEDFTKRRADTNIIPSRELRSLITNQVVVQAPRYDTVKTYSEYTDEIRSAIPEQYLNDMPGTYLLAFADLMMKRDARNFDLKQLLENAKLENAKQAMEAVETQELLADLARRPSFLDGLPEELAKRVLHLGEERLVHEYSQELLGKDDEKNGDHSPFSGLGDAPKPRTARAETEAKLALVAAQEVKKCGGTYEGLRCVDGKEGQLDVTIRVRAESGWVLDRAALMNGFRRHLPAGVIVNIKVQVTVPL
jgi:hypothetical protein